MHRLNATRIGYRDSYHHRGRCAELQSWFSFANLKSRRSHAMAYRVTNNALHIPGGIYHSLDSTARSLRATSVDNEHLLIVRRNSHMVGRQTDMLRGAEGLDTLTDKVSQALNTRTPSLHETTKISPRLRSWD